MEIEIAAIETQHHRAMIERQLAEVWLDCDCSFSSPTAMTGHHAKASNCQIDPTTATTSALAIDMVAYLYNIDTCKEEAHLYMLKIPTYKGEFYLKL